MPAIFIDEPYVEILEGVTYPKVGHQLAHSLVRGAIVAILKRCAADRGYVRRARELVAERFVELQGLWEKFNG